MKIVVELDDEKKEVYQFVTDAYLAVRQLEPMGNKKGKVAVLPETKSYSWGPNIRELTKEVAQSLVELQELLRGLKNGSN